MKKFLFLLFASMFASVAYSYDYNYRKVDKVPDVGHYTWYHELNQTTNYFTFYDKFSLGVAANRKYIVHVYERKPGESSIIMAYRADKPSDCWYHYGVLTPNGISENEIGSKEYINDMEFSIDPEGHTGGEVGIPLGDIIEKAYNQNYTELRIVVEELTRPNVMWDWYPVETESRYDRGRGLFHNNYLDVDLKAVYDCQVEVSAQTVNYADNFSVTGKYSAAHAATLTLQYREKDGNFWYDLAKRSISDQEAKAGYSFTYKRVFVNNGVEAEREYRLKAFDKVRKDYTYSTVKTVSFYYDYEDPQGYKTGKKQGQVITLTAPAAGKVYQVISDIPVELQQEGTGYWFYMPACNVRVKEVNNLYTVQFRDYDNTVLKTQQVEEGHNATPPANPVREGYIFTGWNKPYTNIQESQVIRALYTIEGIEAELTCANPIAIQGGNVTFEVRLKTPTSKAVRAYLDAAWIDNEDDAVNFGSSAAATVDFTKEEAAAGTTKSLDVTALPNGSLNFGHRARYFRLRIRFSGSTQDYIFNIVRVDTYYQITVDNQVDELNAYVAIPDGQTYFVYDDNKIYARPLDTIHATDYSALACPLKFQFSPTPVGDVKTGDNWVVVPAGYGEGMLTISHEKHQVLFYAEGHHDGWYNLEFGEGVYEPQEITCGGMATPPELGDDVLTGKVFRGWKARGSYADDAYLEVTEPMIFDALLEAVPTYTVTFKDWDGTTLDTQEVNAGASALPPVVENRYGYDFIGWDQDFSTVTSPMIIIAQYEAWPESIDEIRVTGDKARKYVIDGAIYIALPDGHIYNANGEQVR